MKSTADWARRALAHTRALSKGIGGRHATSDGERRAAAYVRDELARLGLAQVRVEPFRGAALAWMAWSVALSLAAWGMLIGLLFGPVGSVIATGLYLLAAWIVYRELSPSTGFAPASRASRRTGQASTGSATVSQQKESLPFGDLPVRRWLWRGDSQNVLGVVAPSGTAERRAVLMAYLDSGHVSYLWRSARLRRLVRLLRPLLFYSLLVSALAFLLTAISNEVLLYFLALLMLFPQVAALFASIFSERGPVSPGANNNAAGVGTLLALAERLKTAPLAHTEVWLLATGCRETGGDGLRAFLAQHGATLDETVFLALEGVGVGERVVYLTGEGALRSTPYAHAALPRAERAAERCRQASIPVSAARHRGGPTEMGIIARAGLEGLAINVWPGDLSGAAGRRRRDDTIDNIQVQALARAHTFAWALLEELDTQ